jgi:hypothetical protein
MTTFPVCPECDLRHGNIPCEVAIEFAAVDEEIGAGNLDGLKETRALLAEGE